jgi:CheY-like chemotaxis protein
VRDGAVVIEIEDNGVGVPAEALRRLGEPYFSTRVSQGGTGLGLFVVRGIVEALGGTLTFTSEVGVGTCARVMLPCAAPVAPADEPALGTPSPDAPRARVLIVDDDHDVALAAARLLRGVDTELAASGPAALARLGDDADFDAILCDIVMPGMSGLELRDELRRRHPRLAERLVFMTGGATLPEVAAVLRRPDVRHIQKPFDRRTLRAALAEVLALGQPIR